MRNGHNMLVKLVKDGDFSRWKYSATPDKVYVRGSEGFIAWSRIAPGDLRDVIILNID